MKRWLPAYDWMLHYQKANLKGDLQAGLTVAVMLIPQGMAYAMLAGLSPATGLYASLVPLALYALFGSSRELAVGPVAMVSLLVAASIGSFATDPAQYLQLAVTLAFMVGVIQFLMGVVRMGFLVSFLSHPVLHGFTSAAAIIIGTSQLKHAFGISMGRSHHIHEIVMDLSQKVTGTHVLTLIVSIASISLLLGLKRWNKAIPGALIAVVLSSLATWFFGLDGKGLSIVGVVPAGLPSLSLPTVDMKSLQLLWPTALTISLVGFMESISVAKSIASKKRYRIDANQELIALGLANLGAAVTKAYPVTGGFSRTAVNNDAGARTGLASLITAFIIGLALLFFTPLFYYLPKAVLASIILVAIFGLINLKEFFHLWKLKKGDAFVFALTFVVTLTIGMIPGLAVGAFFSMSLFIHRSMRPHTAILGNLPDSETYRNVERFKEAKVDEAIAILRFDASLYFANADYYYDEIMSIVREGGESLKAIILDAAGINDLDASGLEKLFETQRELSHLGIALLLTQVKGPVRDLLQISGFSETLGASAFTDKIHDAVLAARSHIDSESA